MSRPFQTASDVRKAGYMTVAEREAEKVFEVGSIHVLLHGDGGRLLKVYEVTPKGIIEKASIPSQQKYAYEYNPADVVWCRSTANAERLVAAMTKTHETYREVERKAKAARDLANVMLIQNANHK